MSYILDALRKADAERERDPARGIHAQPMAAAPQAAGGRPAGLWLGVAGACVVLAGAGAYAWSQRADRTPAPAPTALSAPAPVFGPAAAAPVPVVAPVAVASVVEPAPPAPAVVAAPPKAAPERMAGRAAVAAPAVPVPAVPAVARTVGKAAGEAQVARLAPNAAAAQPARVAEKAADAPLAKPADKPAAEAAGRIYAVAELPPDVQRDLPKLAISGGVYSENVAQRMLIVGGQVVNEGSELAPGVVLEQIRARAAVLRFRNYRYSVAY